MNEAYKLRIAWALKCERSEVPEKQPDLKAALEHRRAELKAKKAAKKVHDGQSVH